MPRPDSFNQGRADAIGDIVAPERRLLIPLRRSIIPAADVESLDDFERLVEATGDIPGIGGYKVGLELAMTYGLGQLVDRAREHTNLPIIYDHQKAGNDIPDMGRNFASAAAKSGVESVILFPFTGPKTEADWIKACQDEGLTVIVGGHMTHPQFLERDGGSVSDSAPARIYRLAAENGVTDFVVPGNRADYVLQYRRLLESILGKDGFTLYAPGFVSQGGDVSETGRVAGENWHAIVGRGIYGAKDMRQAALDLTTKLLATPVEEQEDVVFQEQSGTEKLAARQERVMQILREVGAFKEGHFLLKSGNHSDRYVDKSLLTTHTRETREVCRMMADDFRSANIEVVVAPAVGAVILSQEVAEELGSDVLPLFAEKEGRDREGNETFKLRGSYPELVAGRRVLLVEDILTTGGSVVGVKKAVEAAGGQIVGIAGIVNRGGVTAEKLNVPRLSTLASLEIPMWTPDACGLCHDGVPIDNQVGHGGQQQLTHP